MITYNDFNEAKLANGQSLGPLPNQPNEIDGRKVIRSKAIVTSDIVRLCMTDANVAENLRFRDHDTRPFVVYVIELE